MKDANAATPSQPCPAGWEFLGKPATLAVKYEWWMDDDKNGNGVVCVKFVGSDGKAIVKDDNTATPSQPCPPSFTPAGKISTPKADADAVMAADDDGDKVVCGRLCQPVAAVLRTRPTRRAAGSNSMRSRLTLVYQDAVNARSTSRAAEPSR